MALSDYAVDTALRDGTPVHIRAIRPDDKGALVQLFNSLSPETRYYRFLGAKTCLTDDELAYLTELDFVRQAALVAELELDNEPTVVAVARYATYPHDGEDRPEVALAVMDDQQSRGLGTLLLTHLAELAAEQGISEFDAYLLADNEAMLSVFRRCGFQMRGAVEGGVLRLVLTLPNLPSG
jgi:GNAT superfamily N-acetyltransferase